MTSKLIAIFIGLFALTAFAETKPGLVIFTGKKGAQIEKAYAEGSVLVLRTVDGEERISYYTPNGAQEAADFIHAGSSISVESCLKLELVETINKECKNIKGKTGIIAYEKLKVVGLDCKAYSFTPVVSVITKPFQKTGYTKEDIYVTRQKGTCSGAETF